MKFTLRKLYELFIPRVPAPYPPLSGAKADEKVVKVARRGLLFNRVFTPMLVILGFFVIVHLLLSTRMLHDTGSSYKPVPRRIIEEHARKVEAHRTATADMTRKALVCKKENASWAKHRLAQGRFNLSGIITKHMVAVPRYVAMSGTWDGGASDHILGALRQLGHGATLIDVGAGLGWYTLTAAYSGFHVIAVDPDMNHMAMLQHSLCLAPPAVRARVTVLGYALGRQNGGTCSLWKRHGDTVTICDEKQGTRLGVDGYSKVGRAKLRSIDGLQLGVAGPYKVVMKVDVCGYEPFVLYGAGKFLRDSKPKYIYTSFDRNAIETAAQNNGLSKQRAAALPDEFLSQMSQAGYDYTHTRRNSKGENEIALTRA